MGRQDLDARGKTPNDAVRPPPGASPPAAPPPSRPALDN
ncbi:Hypothetical protein I596_1197 [Dokdonella koreensis DS-123]|uniref:Uncharacterized protein n=1 Tax=Dokdonella koreensis DS-123 TaxID=1300342 RepID=A0A160DSG5_9GAMM|nr:Hypothetical protein I596_1197 [Dokdonella koreensis DS-123]